MTTPMFAANVAENDRLLLQENQRRQDVINEAVSNYAPHLAGKPDIKAIHIYSTNATLRKEIRELAGSQTVVVEHCLFDGRERKGVNEVQHNGLRMPLPEKADLVVTKSGLNAKVEWLAARMGAMVAVLPEAGDYVRARLEKQGLLILVGADQSK